MAAGSSTVKSFVNFGLGYVSLTVVLDVYPGVGFLDLRNLKHRFKSEDFLGQHWEVSSQEPG